MFSRITEVKPIIEQKLNQLNNRSKRVDKSSNYIDPLSYYNFIESLLIDEFKFLCKELSFLAIRKNLTLKDCIDILETLEKDFTSYYILCENIDKILVVPKEVFSLFSYKEIEDIRNIISPLLKEMKALYKHKTTYELYRQSKVLTNNSISKLKHTKSLYNIAIPHEDDFKVIDELIITSNGIFALKIFNFSRDNNAHLEVFSDGRAFKYHGMKKTLISRSLQEDLSTPCSYIEKYINLKLNSTYNKHIAVNPLVLVINDDASIINSCNIPILNISSLYNTIIKHDEILDIDLINYCYENITANFLSHIEEIDFKFDLKNLDFLRIVFVYHSFIYDILNYLRDLEASAEATLKDQNIKKEFLSSRYENIKKFKMLYLALTLMCIIFILYKGILTAISYEETQSFNNNLQTAIENHDETSLNNILSDNEFSSSQKKAFLSLLKDDDSFNKNIKSKSFSTNSSENIPVENNIYLTNDKKIYILPLDIKVSSKETLYFNDEKCTSENIRLMPGIYSISKEIPGGKKEKIKDLKITSDTEINLN